MQTDKPKLYTLRPLQWHQDNHQWIATGINCTFIARPEHERVRVHVSYADHEKRPQLFDFMNWSQMLETIETLHHKVALSMLKEYKDDSNTEDSSNI